MGGRLSILDERPYNSFLGCCLLDTMDRAHKTEKSKRGGIILLALPPCCLVSQIAVFDLAADLRYVSTILYCILCWIWFVLGRVWTGMVGAEEEECISCFGR